jgi:hypothetical protein
MVGLKSVLMGRSPLEIDNRSVEADCEQFRSGIVLGGFGPRIEPFPRRTPIVGVETKNLLYGVHIVREVTEKNSLGVFIRFYET